MGKGSRSASFVGRLSLSRRVLSRRFHCTHVGMRCIIHLLPEHGQIEGGTADVAAPQLQGEGVGGGCSPSHTKRGQIHLLNYELPEMRTILTVSGRTFKV